MFLGLQQENDPNCTSTTSELSEEKQNEDFGATLSKSWPESDWDVLMWHDLKKAVHAWKPSNVAELQQFYKDEWAKIPPQRCKRLIASYRKRLVAAVAAKGGPTSY